MERPYSISPVLMAGLALLLGVAAYIQLIAGLAGDKSLVMYITGSWLKGKHLYTDLYELNPPLIYILYALPALMAQWSGLYTGYVLTGLVLALVAAVIAVAQRLLAAHPCWSRTIAPAHALLLGLVLVVWSNPAHFGDREHLFYVLTLPYALRFMPSLRQVAYPLSLRVGVGALGAVGFCIKPYCFILFVTVGLLLLLRERSLRYLFMLESGIVLLFTCCYVLAMGVYAPAYFTQLLPVAFATYGETTIGIAQISFFAMSFFFGSITFADFGLRYTSPYRSDILYLIGLCLGFLVYIFAGNRWAYTFYPLDATLLYLTGWVWLEFRYLAAQNSARGLPVKPFIFGARACGANILLHVVYIALFYGSAFAAIYETHPPGVQDRINSDLEAALREHHAKSFGVMPATFGVWQELERRTGAVRQTRFTELWMIPKFLTGDREFASRNAWVLQFVADAYAEDLSRNKPEIVFVDAGPEFNMTGHAADLIAMFSRYPEFTEAWADYERVNIIDHCEEVRQAIHKMNCRYDVYQRKSAY